MMQGVNKNTEIVLKALAEAEWNQEYTLIGGTALALQINHRFSEDLDFCKWKISRDDQPTIDFNAIEKDLNLIGIAKKNIFDFNQVEYLLQNGVKVSFYANQMYQSPVISKHNLIGLIQVPDLLSLGAMKLELLQRRSNFRDYYDIYSILKEGISLKKMVALAGKYTRHQLKSKNMLSFILNGDNYRYEEEFTRLNPKYPVKALDIQQFIEKCYQQEYA